MRQNMIKKVEIGRLFHKYGKTKKQIIFRNQTQKKISQAKDLYDKSPTNNNTQKCWDFFILDLGRK